MALHSSPDAELMAFTPKRNACCLDTVSSFVPSYTSTSPPNGWRYLLVGGTRERHFDGANLKPRKLLENAQTPTTIAPADYAGVRVHAVLAGVLVIAFKF